MTDTTEAELVVTQEDREAAADFLKHGMIDLIYEATAQAFARHREAAVLREREACAAVADEFEREENDRAWDKRQVGRDDNFNCARASAATHIAESIRSRTT